MTRNRKQGRPREATRGKAFYDAAVSEAERVDLKDAARVEGLDQEIAMLRLRLRRTAEEHPENLSLMLKGVGTLVKAVAANYGLSQKNENDLADRIKEMLGAFEPLTRLEEEGDAVADNDN